jgi:hypothetical protein
MQDESTDEALVVNGGAHDGEQHICQDEDIMSVRPTIRRGAVYATAKGSSRQFYVLVDQQPPFSPSKESSDEGAGSDLMDSVSQGFHYEFSEEDVDEMYAALATTNTWQKALEAEASQPEYGVKKKKGGNRRKRARKRSNSSQRYWAASNRVGAVLTQARASSGM